ncbi:zinc-binding dehydrogenase [Micromonospora sp. NPDC047548]|uniref:zinc-binding dehydrogenase n=1 Tax=Micromonospora sp. NPDC047548 TaxID=3155624 RepID=UPI00340AD4CF
MKTPEAQRRRIAAPSKPAGCGRDGRRTRERGRRRHTRPLVGGEYGRRSLECLRPGGLLLGAALDPGVTEEDADRRGRPYRWLGGTRMAQPLDVVRDLVDAKQLKVHVERTYPLSELPAAHARAETGRVTGKLVITIDDEPAVGWPTPP